MTLRKWIQSRQRFLGLCFFGLLVVNIGFILPPRLEWQAGLWKNDSLPIANSERSVVTMIQNIERLMQEQKADLLLVREQWENDRMARELEIALENEKRQSSKTEDSVKQIVTSHDESRSRQHILHRILQMPDQKLSAMALEYLNTQKRYTVKPWNIEFLDSHRSPCWKNSESKIKCLPGFYIAGFNKCSSTVLWNRLIVHPEIQDLGTETAWDHSINRKELWWWSLDGVDPKRLYRNFDDYIALFDEAGRQPKKIIGDGTPDMASLNYKHWGMSDKSQFSKETAAALKNGEITNPHLIVQYTPQAKFIFLMRNPTDKLLSHFLHINKQAAVLREKGNKRIKVAANLTQDFHKKASEQIRRFKACEANKSTRQCAYDPNIHSASQATRAFVIFGLYYVFIQDAMKLAPKENMIFELSEDHTRDGASFLGRITRFLGVSDDPKIIAEMLKVGAEPRVSNSDQNPMMPETRKLLDDFYRPYNQRLVELLGDQKFAFKTRTNENNDKAKKKEDKS